MDAISHFLLGSVVATFANGGRRNLVTISLFGVLPDVPVAAVYVMLGKARGRVLWIPENSDWDGIRASHPVWSAIWEIPHSFLFLLLVIFPLVFMLRLPALTVIAYASHLVSDIFTHSGEWSMRPLYPLKWTVAGFTDAWRWPLWYMSVSWLILVVVIVARYYYRRFSSTG